MCTPTTMRQLWGLVADVDVRAALPVVSCPTLVIAERESRPGNSEFLAEHIDGAELCLLDGDEHMPIHGTARFEEWMTAIEGFVAGTRIGEIDIDRVLGAVVFVDIVESTRTAARIGDRAWRQLLDRYEDAAGELAGRFGGRVVKSTGDGTLAFFDGPARAVRYTAALNDTTEELGVELRGGVHVGEIELRGDDIGGLAVHVAARVQSKAAPGQVLVSQVVEQLCLGSGLSFEPVGNHELKGVPGTWELRRLTT